MPNGHASNNEINNKSPFKVIKIIFQVMLYNRTYKISTVDFDDWNGYFQEHVQLVGQGLEHYKWSLQIMAHKK